ncbi:MAG: NADH:flavin oxidoreductase/NADH oxidase [Spirochaetaceae bacterium]|nr:MAG: NADH:flavin oxidoreductase/NADH oxidase [Spirochaetaceae bacterium]
MSYEYLLSPIRVGRVTIPNRIVMPPLVIWKAGLDGFVTDEHVAHYARSAGPGLCIVEATAVSPEGRLAATQIGAWSDEHTDGLARLAATIHDSGAVAGIQIHHAGGRTNAQKNGGLPILVPSHTEKTPDSAVVLSGLQIEKIIEDFGVAARRCIAAGFDVIEIHGAHGYLGSQFLSPSTNKRTDEWGGDIDNRVRFLTECVRTVREEARAAERPVIVAVRLGVLDGGTPPLTQDDGCAAAIRLAEAGVELFDISHAGSLPDVESAVPWSQTLELARATKSCLDVPVIGVGGIKTPAQAEEALDAEIADMIAVGRAILADQAWAAKTIAGTPEQIALCIDCKPRCFHFTDPEKCPPRRAARSRDA